MTMYSEKLYKDKYILAFYEKDDDTLKYIFNNIKEVCEKLNLEVNKRNMNKIQVDIYRSIRRPNHQTNFFRGQCLKVYIVDITDEDE